MRVVGIVLLVAVALSLSMTSSRVVAQQATVAINVVDYNGKLLPFEQFRAESNDHCAPNGAALVHLHANNGPATAIDLSEVPDPAPQGCGFGVLQAGAGLPAATVRLANVTQNQVAAWSKKTGVEILSVSAAIPANAADEVRAGAATRRRLVLFAVIPAAVIAGLVVGVLLYSCLRRRQRGEVAPTHLGPRTAWDDPEDGGLLRERLARGHARLPDTTAEVAMPSVALGPRHENAEPDTPPRVDDQDDR